MSKYSLCQVVQALREHHGLLSLAADALGCSRQTLYNYVQRHSVVAEVLAEERERFIDLAERGLYDHLQAQSPWAISLTLKTLGRQRGYVDPTMTRRVGVPAQETDVQEWLQIQYTLLRTLEHFPEARLAVVEALKALEPHESNNGHYQGA
jgi:hypothetical protein